MQRHFLMANSRDWFFRCLVTTYGSTLDVPTRTPTVVTGWGVAHRRRCDIRPWQRAATVRTQALLGLRWFKDTTRVPLLARDTRRPNW